jgi:hypothetical protein
VNYFEVIVINVVVVIVIGIIASVFHRLRAWFSLWNDELSLRINRDELARMEAFKTDKGEMTRFLLQQLLFGMTMAGASMLFLSVDIMGHAELVAFVRFVFGTMIYGLGIHAAAMAWRSKTPDRFIVSLQKRIAVLESRIEAKAATRKLKS